MEISSTGSTVTITGNIKSIDDLQQIKSSLDNLTIDNKSITLKIINSISITSSVIGYFTKLIYKNNIHISMQVGDIRLYELLDELSLVSQFNVRKI